MSRTTDFSIPRTNRNRPRSAGARVFIGGASEGISRQPSSQQVNNRSSTSNNIHQDEHPRCSLPTCLDASQDQLEQDCLRRLGFCQAAASSSPSRPNSRRSKLFSNSKTTGCRHQHHVVETSPHEVVPDRLGHSLFGTYSSIDTDNGALSTRAGNGTATNIL